MCLLRLYWYEMMYRAGCMEQSSLVSLLLCVCEGMEDVHSWLCAAGASNHPEAWIKESSGYRLPSRFQSILHLENNYFPGREVLSNRSGCHA